MSTVADRPQAADPLALPPPSAWALARARVRAYVSLTKPRIVELLLVTTVPAMVVADAHRVTALGARVRAGARRPRHGPHGRLHQLARHLAHGGRHRLLRPRLH